MNSKSRAMSPDGMGGQLVIRQTWNERCRGSFDLFKGKLLSV